jgi:hypothetical protein
MTRLDLLALCGLLAGATCVATSPLRAQDHESAARLATAMLGETPLIGDARSLTDEVGGRPTGSEANLQSVEWALERFREAGVEAHREAFMMPEMWLENSASATVHGDGVQFDCRIAAMPFSTGTPPEGITAPLVFGGHGTPDDFERLGDEAQGAFVLIATEKLMDVAGLFKEYTDAAAIERRAFAAGVAGVVYTGSRPNNLLHRHLASSGVDNQHPLFIMERDAATRAKRLLHTGKRLEITARIDIQDGGPYESYNVIGEIRGATRPEEIVVIGAHLDSWGLGTGALDNGANVALVIDIARQIVRLGLQPDRTIRFALWNGEEQGLVGSWRYTQQHEDELDNIVMASSYDLGTGRITGFFTGGRPEMVEAVERTLEPVRGLGPFEHVDWPIVGTDNFDFMMQGIGNLVANQAPANYGPNYHARSDTFDKVDQHQHRLNAAIAAAVTYGFATMDVTWQRQTQRQTREEIAQIIAATDLGDQMRTFGIWQQWESGERGRTR